MNPQWATRDCAKAFGARSGAQIPSAEYPFPFPLIPQPKGPRPESADKSEGAGLEALERRAEAFGTAREGARAAENGESRPQIRPRRPEAARAARGRAAAEGRF